MPHVLILGAGLNGLAAAMLLARDGHRVTVLERDPDEPPDPRRAWDGWARQGCNQFRQPHFISPCWRRLVEAELPDVPAALLAAGARSYDLIGVLPAAVTGGRRAGDGRYTALTARRPVLEAVLGRLAAAEPGVTIRRGTAVRRLLTGTSDVPGVPHVSGVVTAAGEQIAADVVVDAGGRRSPLGSLLADAGAPGMLDHREDSGFVYYGRHFRGAMPTQLGALLQHYDSVSLLTLPADNGTWSVTFTASSRDVELRALREPAGWAAALGRYPRAAHWGAAEPITGVTVMAGIEDRIRYLVADGRPVATGVLAVGDAWACTNPSLGRGAAIGLMHACLLRDVLRETGPDRPAELALNWDDATRRELEPWYRATLAFDRHRLAEIEADRSGVPYATGDPRWHTTKAMAVAAGDDPEVLRALFDITTLQALPPEVLGRPGVMERITAGSRGAPQYHLPGPNRASLLAAISALPDRAPGDG